MQLFDNKKLIIKPAASLVLLFSLFLFMLIAVSLITQLLGSLTDNTAAILRISSVLQNVLVFILPAVATAMLSTRFPATLLAVDKFPSGKFILLSIAVLIVSIPLMNSIIDWNQNITLPDSFSQFNDYMQQLEKGAEKAVSDITGGNTVGTLIMSILIVGIFTGLGEEIFFRGGLMRLFSCIKGMSPHVAIWLTAFLFSALHMQFLGFVPRMLLGVFFGYLTFWSGSLWLPIMIHALNNSILVTTDWINNRGGSQIDVNSIGLGDNALVLNIASIILTVIVFYALYKQSKLLDKKNDKE